MPPVLGIPAWLTRAVGRVLLLALCVAAVGPLVHGVHQDDCDPAVVLHDASAHHVERTSPSAPDDLSDHCVACHFARSSRGAAAWQSTRFEASDRGVLLYHSDGFLIAASAVGPLPSRAPPTSS